eukprot:TRINITY_DN55637_c0_g1_i1.p1 TRINITY_DN55637_c0_g1~~TRINITY_DN55637_c0_g1_i1.p1  ORF type:complete len:272 (+),score=30.93 TRINITY_DN55637_c0_g1_i1:87-902(+)
MWDWLYPGLVVLTGLGFLPEVVEYFQLGRYAGHTLAGGGAYSRWAQPRELNPAIHAHAAACYAWLALALYQFRSRGKGAHRAAGYAAIALAVPSILAANMMLPTTIPAAHQVWGVPVFDLALHGAFAALGVALVRGVVAVRRGNIKQHEAFMRDAVCITAAPAIYRLLVAGALWVAPGAAASQCGLSAVHEGGIASATLVSLACFGTRAELSRCLLIGACILLLADLAYLHFTDGCAGRGVVLYSHADEPLARDAASRRFVAYALGVDWRW